MGILDGDASSSLLRVIAAINKASAVRGERTADASNPEEGNDEAMPAPEEHFTPGASSVLRAWLSRHGSPEVVCGDQAPAEALWCRPLLPIGPQYRLFGAYAADGAGAILAQVAQQAQQAILRSGRQPMGGSSIVSRSTALAPWSGGRLSALALAVRTRQGASASVLLSLGADPT